MYGVGWHQSMEKGKTLSYYAMKPGPSSKFEEIVKRQVFQLPQHIWV